jgi:T4 RnlA family RNA ligase
MGYLPTYEDAKAMVAENGELVFYETERYINGFKVSTFNYRLPLYTNFITPLKNKIEADAKELRGLTFVFNSDGSLYKRFLLMRKFWNVNQVPESMYSEIKDYELKSCYNKEDGSLITFIQLPDGKVVTKTKMGFDNEQTEAADRIYNSNEKINNFVNYCLDNDIISMWEFVSFKNRIVLNYDKENLILLKLRDNKTGNYLDIEEYRDNGFDIVEQENYTLDEFIELSETLTDKEGCVFTLIDKNGNDLMVKKKTEWYFTQHNLVTNEINREDYVIKAVLTDVIDDIVAQLDKVRDADKILFINNIEEIVTDFLKERITEVEALVDKYDGSKKDFAIRYKKDNNFGLAMAVINNRNDVYTVVKEWLLYQTKRLEAARSFINRKGFKRK